MHQTICGEIHKSIVYNKDKFKDFLKSEKSLFNEYYCSSMLYQHQNIVKNINNYLNQKPENEYNIQLKKILLYEYNNCEKIYPLLGDLFLDILFQNKAINKIPNKKKFPLTKEIIEKNLKSLKVSLVKEIINKFIENCSLEYNVSIEKSNIEKIVLEKNNSIVFDNEIDMSYFGKYNFNSSNFKYFLINGYIQSVSEIHHLLQASSENKGQDYILFCMGVDEEVKRTIKINNNKRNTRLYPVSFKFNEENINILNDIALILNAEIINSDKGQTLSQAAFNEFQDLGKKIKINVSSGNFSIEPLCNQKIIKQHIEYLSKRIKISESEVNKKYIQKRIKNLSSKTFKIFLPENKIKDNDFVKELNYYLNFLANSNKEYILIKNKINIEKYFLPFDFYSIVLEKVKSFKKIFNNIEKIVCN